MQTNKVAKVPSAPRGTLLSLFDGTGSICEPFLKAGWRVSRLDVDGRHGADIVVDIRDWDPARDWSGPAPDVIFAGPPCEHYSSARTKANTPRDLKLADSLVRKTIEIIEHFHAENPRLQYFVENPDSSMLWKRWASHRLYRDPSMHYCSTFVKLMNGTPGKKSARFVADAKRKAFKAGCSDRRVVRLDYCMYGTKYRKRTRLMTNNPFRGTLCDKTCSGSRNGKHVEVAQRGPYTCWANGKRNSKRNHTLDELHAYPPGMVDEVLKHVTRTLLRKEPRRGIALQIPEPVLRPPCA